MEKSLLRENIVTEWADLKPISWSAVIAGAIVSLAISALLNSLGFGIGMSAFNTSESGVTTYAIGGVLWLIISTFIAMAVGGLVAGLLVRTSYRSFGGALHGFLVWGLASLLTFLLIGSVAVPTIAGIAQGTASNPALTNSSTVQGMPTPTYPHRMSDSQYYPGHPTPTSTPIETQKAATYTGALALVTFFVLLLGLIGAVIGGRVGVREGV